MILKRTPLSMAEVLEYLGENKETKSFIKKFTKLNEKKAKEIRKDLESLDLIKLNESGVAKIIETMPETKEELNKTILEINLDEDETNKVLETIKKHI